MNSVECKLCDKKFKAITHLHVKHKHGITLSEYKLRFPNAKLSALSSLWGEGREPWNKGLTKETDERVKKYGEKISIRRKKQWEDPLYRERMRGLGMPFIGIGKDNPFYGKTHKKETKELIGNIIKDKWEDPKSVFHTKEYKKKHKKGLVAIKEKIICEMENLSKKGFKTIPLHHYFPVPDIIAIKDGRVYAIEIQDHNPTPEELAKYDGLRKTVYDDIWWIIKEKASVDE